MSKKVILITTTGKISLVDNLDYELDLNSIKALTAMETKYKLDMFQIDQSKHEKNHIATNWLRNLRYNDRIYANVVFGDVLILSGKGGADKTMLRAILRFVISDKKEFHRAVKELRSQALIGADNQVLSDYVNNFIET